MTLGVFCSAGNVIRAAGKKLKRVTRCETSGVLIGWQCDLSNQKGFKGVMRCETLGAICSAGGGVPRVKGRPKRGPGERVDGGS